MNGYNIYGKCVGKCTVRPMSAHLGYLELLEKASHPQVTSKATRLITGPRKLKNISISILPWKKTKCLRFRQGDI